MSKAKPRSRPDWELIENEYRIGQLTVRQMADKHGVNKTTITDRAKKHGWTRDLSEAVRVATKAALVLSETDKHGQNTDKAIATAADLNRQIIEAHRTDMADQRALMAELRAELRKAQAINALTDNVVDATKLALALGLSTAEVGVLTKQLRDSFSLPSRVMMIKALAETAVKTVTIERQAYSLDEKGAKAPVDQATLDKMDPHELLQHMLQSDSRADQT